MLHTVLQATCNAASSARTTWTPGASLLRQAVQSVPTAATAAFGWHQVLMLCSSTMSSARNVLQESDLYVSCFKCVNSKSPVCQCCCC
jgi:hypothetical protein